MPHFPSPYALLCASKPKPPHAVTSTYDLYSLSQATDTPLAAQAPAPIPAAPAAQAQSMPAQPKKTHYISDIHARHTKAMRRTVQSPV